MAHVGSHHRSRVCGGSSSKDGHTVTFRFGAGELDSKGTIVAPCIQHLLISGFVWHIGQAAAEPGLRPVRSAQAELPPINGGCLTREEKAV